MAKKIHFTKHYPILKKSIRTAINILRKDVKDSIQYDHFGDRMKMLENISQPDLVKMIYHAAKDAYHQEKDVREVVTSKVADNSVMRNFLKTALEASSQGIVQQITLNTFGKKNISLTNARQIAKELQNLGSQSDNVETLVSGFNLGLTVPKNSDKATDDKREFVFKSLIQEILLSAIVIQNYRRNPKYEELFYDPNVSVYGTSLLRMFEKDFAGNTVEFKFSNYIHEYDDFKDTTYRLHADGYDHIHYADISKFFDSISHDLIVDALWAGFVGFDYSDTILNKSRFRGFVKNLLNVNGNDHGLTIESHFQHLIAKIVIEYMFSGFTNKLTRATFRNIKKIKVLFYVDDIIIMADNERTLDYATNEINEILTLNGFALNATKSSFNTNPNKKRSKRQSAVDRCGIGFEELKTLVRLPGTGYFDLDEGDLVELSGGVAATRYHVTLDRIDKLAKYFNDKGELLADADTVEIIKTIADFDIDNCATNSAILTQIITCTIYTLRDDYRKFTPKQKESVEDELVYIDDKWCYTKGILNSAKNITFIENKAIANKFKLRDIMFMYKNQNKFIFGEDTMNEYLTAIKAKDDSKILDALQYFYLTDLQCSTYVATVVEAVLLNYPSKIKFLAAIVKRQLARFNGLSYTTTTSEFTNVYNIFMMKFFNINGVEFLEYYINLPKAQRLNDPMFFFTYRMFKKSVNLVKLANKSNKAI